MNSGERMGHDGPAPEGEKDAAERKAELEQQLHEEMTEKVLDFLEPLEQWRQAAAAGEKEEAAKWQEAYDAPQDEMEKYYGIKGTKVYTMWGNVRDYAKKAMAGEAGDRRQFTVNGSSEEMVDKLDALLAQRDEDGQPSWEDADLMRMAAELTVDQTENWWKVVDEHEDMQKDREKARAEHPEMIFGIEDLEAGDKEREEFLNEHPELKTEMGKATEKLIAVNLNLEQDARDAAHDIAEKMFAEKKKSRGFFGKIIGGLTDTPFREYKIKKYEAQAMEAIRQKQAGAENGLSDKDWSADKSGIARFVEAYVNSYEEELIHEKAGEEMFVYGVEKDEHGNKKVYRYGPDKDGNETKVEVPADSWEAQVTVDIRDAIARYAEGKMDRASFEDEMKRIKAELPSRNKDPWKTADISVDNYMELAEVAKERARHEAGIENVMEGFRFIDGEARRNVRSEAHRDALDKITNKLTNNKIVGLLPPTVIGAAAGFALAMTQTATKSAMRAVLPGVGGAATAGVFAMLKERNRVTGDRQELARRLARGETAGDTKYDQQMLATMYEMKPANEYRDNLLAKIEAVKEADTQENVDALLAALAMAETAVNYSDDHSKLGRVDLISYSSADTSVIEKERLALDVARAQAKTLVGRDRLKMSKDYQTAIEGAKEHFDKDLSTKDALFRKLRGKREAAQFAKTAVTAGVTMIAGQEIKAIFDPNTYGMFDDLVGKTNNEGATDTVMRAGLGKAARALGLETGAKTTLESGVTAAVGGAETGGSAEPVKVMEREGVELSDEELKALSADDRYIVTSREVKVPQPSEKPVSVSEYAHEHGVSVRRDDWGSNGTRVADGNELGVHFGRGGDTFELAMKGDSTTWGGETINTEQAIADGKIRMLLSINKDNQSTPIELVATMGENGQPVFEAPDEQIQELIANRAYKYAEVVYDNGTDADGVLHVIPLATAVGPGFDGTMTSSVADEITKTVYDVMTIEPAVATAAAETVVDAATTTAAEMAGAGAEMLSFGSAGLPLSFWRKELTLGAPSEETTGGTGGEGETAGEGGTPGETEAEGGAAGETGGAGAAAGTGEAGTGGGTFELGEEEEEESDATGHNGPAPNGGDEEEEGGMQRPENGGEAGNAAGEEAEPEGEARVAKVENPTGNMEIDSYLDWDWDEDEKEHPGHFLNQIVAEHLWYINNAKSRLTAMREAGEISLEQYNELFGRIEQVRLADREEYKQRLAMQQGKKPEDLEVVVPVDKNGNPRYEANPNSDIAQLPMIDRFIQIGYDHYGRRLEEERQRNAERTAAERNGTGEAAGENVPPLAA